jgi:DNA-binding transcriptional LysR family regulator
VFERKYKVFKAVAKNKSFTAGANELYVTQPAVSKLIKELEIELGLILINRKKYGDFLTEEGKFLYEYICDIEEKNDVFIRRLKEKKNTIRIGTTKTIGSYYIIDKIGMLKKENEDLSIHMIVENTTEILKKLEEGQLDIAIVEGDIDSNRYDSAVLHRDLLSLYCSCENELRSREDLSYVDIVKNNLIMREKGSGTRDTIFKTLKKHDIDILESDIFMEISDIEGIKKLVMNNFGVAYLSDLMINDNEKEKIVQVKSFDIKCDRSFTMIWKDETFKKYSEMLKDY